METLSRTDLDLRDAPVLPGLRFRHYADEADIPAIATLINASNAANGVTDHVSDEVLRSDFAHPSHVRPQDGVLLGFVGDQLVAFSSVEYSDTAAGTRHYRCFGDIDPAWRRHGIGGAMMASNEEQLRRLADEHRHPGGSRLATWTRDLDAGNLALVRQRGYTMARIYQHLVRPDLEAIDITPLPVDIEVRPVGAAMLPRLWVAMAEAFRDHFGGQDASEAAFRRWRDDPRMDPDLLVIAFDGDEVTAGVQAAIDPHENEAQGYRRGWTDPVFTRRPWRRRGLACALLGRALAALRERGMTSAQLGVDSANPYQALTLYERHRFEVVRSETEWHKDLGVAR